MNYYCDRCGVAAKARFVLESGDLLFCGHHTNEYKEALLTQDATFDLEFESYRENELQPA